MAPKLSGSVFENRGKLYAQVSLPEPVGRRAIKLCEGLSRDEAKERSALLTELGCKLVEAGKIDHVEDLLHDVAEATPNRLLLVRRVVEAACRLPATSKLSDVTIDKLATDWLEGRLTEKYRDHVRLKRSVGSDASRYKLWIKPKVGDLLVGEFTLEDGERVMAQDIGSDQSRRHVAQFLHRLLAIAVYPCKLLPAHPLPTGFLPKVRTRRAKSLLYPDEDKMLLGCREVPFIHRLLYGLLAREGMRVSEALGLTFTTDLDLERGVINLDRNKTNDPRMWALDKGVVRALQWWKKRAPGSFVFQVAPDHLADLLREHLKLAGVTRKALFEDTEERRHMVVHDLRATFVTLALANGRNEAWVCDRTGHRSSAEVAGYRRAARAFEELGLGKLTPLDEALPEINGSDLPANAVHLPAKGRATRDSNAGPLASEANTLSS